MNDSTGKRSWCVLFGNTVVSGWIEELFRRAGFHNHTTVHEGDAVCHIARGEALRTLLYLFERDAAVKYLRSG